MYEFRFLLEFILLEVIDKGSISNISALVQIMAWWRLGDKPLSKQMLACSPTHICVFRPQLVKFVNYEALSLLEVQHTCTCVLVPQYQFNEFQRQKKSMGNK